ncbi:MAG: MBL fold metallo-hydrolase [Bacteroidota bacterium]
MKITLWGTRGSLASPGPETARYGGNTSCVEVLGADGTVLVLDAGTGLRRLGMVLPNSLRRVDILLTHLHMDHIQGLGFFAPLRNPEVEVHIWGPASTTLNLMMRLTRYLSPPLFPVHLRNLPCKLRLHEVPCGDFEVGEFHISSTLVCHPGPTVGYRIATSDAVLAYLPDHEPALGVPKFPLSNDWTSGYTLAADVDLLIHDAQYSSDEYADRVGWGHSSLQQALKFASLAEVKHLVPFHHDPAHNDDYLDSLITESVMSRRPTFAVTPGTEGTTFELDDTGASETPVNNS